LSAILAAAIPPPPPQKRIIKIRPAAGTHFEFLQLQKVGGGVYPSTRSSFIYMPIKRDENASGFFCLGPDNNKSANKVDRPISGNKRLAAR